MYRSNTFGYLSNKCNNRSSLKNLGFQESVVYDERSFEFYHSFNVVHVLDSSRAKRYLRLFFI